MEDLDPLEWELLVTWQAREWQHECLFKSNLAELCEALKAKQ